MRLSARSRLAFTAPERNAAHERRVAQYQARVARRQARERAAAERRRAQGAAVEARQALAARAQRLVAVGDLSRTEVARALGMSTTKLRRLLAKVRP